MGRHFEVRKAAMAKSNDSKAKLYSKYGKEVLVAAKAGVPDPEMNLALRRVIEKAKADQIPADIIKRAIDKAKSGVSEALSSVTYEGFGPGESTIIVDCLTDNVNRAVSEVRTCFNKSKSKMGLAGCVSHSYESLSIITVSGTDEEEILNLMLEKEIDINDIETENDIVIIYGQPNQLYEIKEAVDTLGGSVKVESFENTRLPSEYVTLEGDDMMLFQRLLSLLGEVDDVQDIYHNVKTEDQE